ncbi:MAG: hypothetical protein ABI333_24960 [bacterium]
MFNRLVWTTALLLALGTAACGDDDDPLTFDDLDQSEQVSNLSAEEYEVFCQWANDNNTLNLGEPFLQMVTVDQCLELDKPDCALSLFVDCAESVDASSTACLDYAECTGPTYPTENRPCDANPVECPEDNLLRSCHHQLYQNGAWIVTTLEPVYICLTREHNHPCLCEIKNAAAPQTCPHDSADYSKNPQEGNCCWNPWPWP